MVKQTSSADDGAARAAKLAALAAEAYRRCDELAQATDEPGRLTRTFCSPGMQAAHARVAAWMTAAGAAVRVDPAGNLRSVYYPPGCDPQHRFLIGSHLDTVIDAGRYDGALGVVLGAAAVEWFAAAGTPLPWGLEVIAFSEEEGVRFGTPFIGSRALVGRLDAELLAQSDAAGISVTQALLDFGANPAEATQDALAPGEAVAYLEPHIEQGPWLEAHDAPLGVVRAIAGQTRLAVEWTGAGGHAGTVAMAQRRDALTAASRWIVDVERVGQSTPGLVATVGRVDVDPNASNCIPRRVRTSLDVRHEDDAVRRDAVARLASRAEEIGRESHIAVEIRYHHEHDATPMAPALVDALSQAVARAGYARHEMVSGAGHDAGVMAAVAPAGMLFLRNPGGVSHDPAESVSAADVAAALAVIVDVIEHFAARPPSA